MVNQPPCVVLDTSVLVAAFFNDRTAHILHAWENGELIAGYSRPILQEYERVLLKIPPIQKKARQWLDALQDGHRARFIEFPSPVAVDIEDSTDRKFLDCAATLQADCVVSLDDHLLSLRSLAGIPILRPHDFLRRFTTAATPVSEIPQENQKITLLQKVFHLGQRARTGLNRMLTHEGNP